MSIMKKILAAWKKFKRCKKKKERKKGEKWRKHDFWDLLWTGRKHSSLLLPSPSVHWDSAERVASPPLLWELLRPGHCSTTHSWSPPARDRPPRPPRRAPPHPLPSSELGAPRWLPCCHALSLHDLPSPVTPTPSARWRWLPHVQLRSDLNETLIALQLPTSLLHLVAHSNVTSFCERGLPSEPMSVPIARSNHSLHPLTMSPRHVRR